jgi:GNAT superfamily N-acetyltransferase
MELIMKYVSCNINEIIDYCYSIKEVFNDEHYYLRTFEDINESLSEYYLIYLKKTIVGYFVLYKFDKGLLKRIFIQEQYRNKGYGKLILDTFNINRLSCFYNNHLAIKFYLNNGFKMVESTQMHLVSFNKLN